MNKQNIGYIAADFQEKDKIEIINWSKTIRDNDLYITSIDGKTKGGHMTDDLHLTFFYGLDEDLINKNDVQDFINTINLESIEIGKIDIFPVADQTCEVLYLSVEDQLGKIRKYNETFKKFPHFTEFQKKEFIPHITIAFVKKGFDVNKFTYTGSKILNIKEIIHHFKI